MNKDGTVNAEIGMRVWGDMDEEGVIVAMTKEWCIYKVKHEDGNSVEYAEPWNDIVVSPRPPTKVAGSLNVGPKVSVAEEE